MTEGNLAFMEARDSIIEYKHVRNVW